MRMPGWCYRCHKIRQVKVSHPRPGIAQVGICNTCQEAENARMHDRRTRRTPVWT